MIQKNKIAVFLDYDNIKINMKTEPPEKLSEEIGYKRLMNWLSEFGEVIVVFVFAPAITIAAYIQFFYELDFISVACPVFYRTKKEDPSLLNEIELQEYEPEEIISINKTDDVMIKTAEMVIDNMPDITHICIGSGDGDFLRIAEMAKIKGKKVMIFFSNYRPSRELVAFADKTSVNKPMLYLFNPIRD